MWDELATSVPEMIFLIVAGWNLARTARMRPEILTGMTIYMAMWYVWLMR